MNTINFSECAKACIFCSLTCSTCADLCLKENGFEIMRECIQRCLECAEICSLCASENQRKSFFLVDVCELCARVCDYCNEECRKHNNKHCLLCAEACHQCAIECRKIAA